MKANELRLNNYVNNCGEIITVDGIDDIDVFNKNIGEIPLHSFQPIPITEQWLVDFGFEKTEWDNNNSFRKMIGNNDYAIVFYSNCICEIGDIIVKEIDFVHQLQNLFFALTGTELELNSK